MKSKTSFFNKTVFLKNITLYWPIWAIYLLSLIVMIPGRLWMYFHENERFYQMEITYSDNLYAVYRCLDLGSAFLLVFAMSVITGMALYNYLYVAKSANMLHAMPVTRRELFVTNVCSGLLFLFLPEILAFVGGVLVCLSFQVTCVEYLGLWLLVMLGVSFLFFATVTFCAMLTGQMLTLPLYCVAFQFVYLGVYEMVNTAVAYLGYGLNEASISDYKLLWLSPLYYLEEYVGFLIHRTYVNTSYQSDLLKLQGGSCVAWYLVMAVLLFAAAYLLYRRRNLEHAGDLVAVSALKPIFRWGVGLTGGFLFAFWFESIMEEVFGVVPKSVVFFTFFLVGIVFFFVADMFVKKSFRILKKQVLAECGIFVCFLAACFGAVFGYAKAKEQYVPDVAEISEASINITYPIELQGDDVEKVISTQRFLLAHAKAYSKIDFQLEDYRYVPIIYTLKDGSTIARYYYVPLNEESIAVLDGFYESEAEVTNFETYLFGENADFLAYNSGYLELYDSDWNYQTEDVVGEDAVAVLLEAVRADVKEGSLQKYNLADVSGTHMGTPYMAYLELYSDYDYEDQDDFWQSSGIYYENYTTNCESTQSVWITFGPDCRHIIDALVKLGLIESEEELILEAE